MKLAEGGGGMRERKLGKLSSSPSSEHRYGVIYEVSDTQGTDT